jgi:hypothetical protein
VNQFYGREDAIKSVKESMEMYAKMIVEKVRESPVFPLLPLDETTFALSAPPFFSVFFSTMACLHHTRSLILFMN